MRRFDVSGTSVLFEEPKSDLEMSRLGRIRALPDVLLLTFYHDLFNQRMITNVTALPELRAEIVARGLSLEKN